LPKANTLIIAIWEVFIFPIILRIALLKIILILPSDVLKRLRLAKEAGCAPSVISNRNLHLQSNCASAPAVMSKGNDLLCWVHGKNSP
jgi:hypothetical protein